MGQIYNKLEFFQVMARRQTGAKPLSENNADPFRCRIYTLPEAPLTNTD